MSSDNESLLGKALGLSIGESTDVSEFYPELSSASIIRNTVENFTLMVVPKGYLDRFVISVEVSK